jgi:hypothetical protein
VAASQVLEDRSAAHAALVIVLAVQDSADLVRHDSAVPRASAARADLMVHRAVGTKPGVVIRRIAVVLGLAAVLTLAALVLAEARALTVVVATLADHATSGDGADLVASTDRGAAIAASALGRSLLASTVPAVLEAPDATVDAPDSAVPWIAAIR